MFYSATVTTSEPLPNGKSKTTENNVLICISTQIETVRDAIKKATAERFRNGKTATGLICMASQVVETYVNGKLE